NEFELAVSCLSEARSIAESLGDDATRVRTRLVDAACDLARGVPIARERLAGTIEEALAHQLDELASTGYSNISYLDVEQRRLREAERVLEVSLVFTAERDIPICNHWQTAVRSRLRLLEGRWSAAVEDAEDALARSGMPLALLWPHLVAGLVPLRRAGRVDDHLERAWELATRLDEPLRKLPVLAALAERMWLTGTADDRVTGVAEMSDSAAVAWATGDLAVWLRRLGIETGVSPEIVAEPYRLSLTGRHAEAAAWWERAGAPFDQALAETDAEDPQLRVRGIERLDLLGATAVADRLRHELRRQGIAQLPSRPRNSTRANPSGLTNRQLDVAKLVARGYTNAQIADRLFISVKTADHHVSAVLTKLGMPSRREVVVQSDTLGLA
ncbi:helix-turn-helix transcriptional regulator, partial [Actinoplanes sp. NPDC051633]|uniref:helix-turn-helix transcriptional regulator n=1 Tax=Actinoplanes sp. NPDC051633 TaxID=3155670 RepID=UPI0034237F44